jgi:hypothetical protein
MDLAEIRVDYNCTFRSGLRGRRDGLDKIHELSNIIFRRAFNSEGVLCAFLIGKFYFDFRGKIFLGKLWRREVFYYGQIGSLV